MFVGISTRTTRLSKRPDRVRLYSSMAVNGTSSSVLKKEIPYKVRLASKLAGNVLTKGRVVQRPISAGQSSIRKWRMDQLGIRKDLSCVW